MTRSTDRGLGLLLLLGGLVGLTAAATLLVEKIELVQDPDYVPTCNISPILSCGSVMDTPQAAAFGFPNPVIGVAGFAIVATIGAVLLAGVRLGSMPLWFRAGLFAGVTFAVVFVHWLIFQSLYRIEALCPYCMVVWAVTIPVFLYTLVALINQGGTAPSAPSAPVKILTEYRGAILTAWVLVILALITVQFWDYWSNLV